MDNNPKATRSGPLSEMLNSSTSQTDGASTAPRPRGLLLEALSLTANSRGRANSDFIFSDRVMPSSPSPRVRSYSSSTEHLGIPIGVSITNQKLAYSIPQAPSPLAELAAEEARIELIESQFRSVLESIRARNHPFLANHQETGAAEAEEPAVTENATLSHAQSLPHHETSNDEDIFPIELSPSSLRI